MTKVTYMNNVLLTGLATLFLMGSLSTAATVKKIEKYRPTVELSQEFVQKLTQEDFEGATAFFDATLSGEMSAGQLKEIWGKLTSMVGPFQGQFSRRSEKKPKFTIETITCQFEKEQVNIRMVFTNRRKVTSLKFTSEPVQKKYTYTLPDYIKFATVRESAITLETPWKTPGILTLPASPGQYPAVILVHDLGPKDRDETTGANKPFRDLAWGLGSQGIAVIRYDKRTLLNDPNINPPLGDYTVQQEFIDDIQAAVTWLKTHASIRSDQIFIVGHGLGGTLIPRIEKNYPQLAGGIIMAGFTQSLTDVISRENNYLNAFDKEISPIEKAEQNKLDLKIAKVIAPELSSAIESAELPLGLSAEYWLDMRVYNPITLAKESKKPLLILQGGRDYQVTLDDFYGWRKNLIQRENTAFKLYLHLNHLFMEGYGKGVRSHPDEYNLRGHLAPVVIDDISQWIHQCVKGIR